MLVLRLSGFVFGRNWLQPSYITVNYCVKKLTFYVGIQMLLHIYTCVIQSMVIWQTVEFAEFAVNCFPHFICYKTYFTSSLAREVFHCLFICCHIIMCKKDCNMSHSAFMLLMKWGKDNINTTYCQMFLQFIWKESHLRITGRVNDVPSKYVLVLIIMTHLPNPYWSIY